MRVFISWSGDESRQVAVILRDWIKKILQTVEPWMSDKDIASGERWSHAVASKLEQAKVGIICLTRDNVSAPWLHFEAGALSKTLDDAYVCPLLLRIEPAAIVGPMSQFQAKRFSHEGVLSILQAIRSHRDHQRTLDDAQFIDTFETLWPSLEKKVSEVHASLVSDGPKREVPDMVAETLELVRTMVRVNRPGASPSWSKVEDLAEAVPYGRRSIAGLSAKAKSVPAVELAKMLAQWDSTLPRLLGDDRKLQAVVQSLLQGQMGNATTTIMSATGYALPEARTFVDSMMLAISRLIGE